jgi:hypothetical protein
LGERLAQDGDRVIRIEPGDSFTRVSANRFRMRLGHSPDMGNLVAAVQQAQAEADLQFVDFTEGALVGVSSLRTELPDAAAVRFTEVWAITRGAVDIEFGPPGADAGELRQARCATRLIDLDKDQGDIESLVCLYEGLRHPDGQVAVAYRAFQRYVPPTRQAGGKGEHADVAAFDREAVRAATSGERRKYITEFLRREARFVLGLEVVLADMDRPLQSLGLDSLMGLQLRNRIEAEMGVAISLVEFLKGLSFNQIVDRAVDALGAPVGSSNVEQYPAMPPPPDLTSESVERLAEDDLNALLSTLLK